MRNPRVLNNVNLRQYNTFGLTAQAREFIVIERKEHLIWLLDHDYFNRNHLILGGGSNVLIAQDQPVVLLNRVLGINILEETEDYALVEAGAGENWHQFVLWCLQHDLGGLENLSLIPGTVGAAPMQNIGAYGVEIKDCFDSLTAFHKQNGLFEDFNSAQCKFGYRESVFKQALKGQYLIYSVRFKLSKTRHELKTSYGPIGKELEEIGVKTPTIQDISRAVITIRQSKLPDPAEIGNSGSFFKNPVVSMALYEDLLKAHPDIPAYPFDSKIKLAAGWLIEQAGWKGYRMGDVGVHAKQALVLVNYGNGKGDELLSLAKKILTSVKSKFGVDLEMEVNVV